ncbi:ssDNA endonuclease and repair protein rad10 [Podospora bellae-mahoneyi]|uniref:SsDNA endonuclease and repair protein rad10 n=1 Tax=Podospora bellae-mahoneyi TaxID=2093777 RepID=A0ABR0FJE6_9PEZI|nr:ssDNA endonuclease and repair protein rad10 [Podospora bellae-mahoneyi]
MDDDFGADAEFLDALASSADAITSLNSNKPNKQPLPPPPLPPPPQQQRPPGPPAFLPPKIQQPTPQRVEKPPPPQRHASATSGPPKIVQPTPQPLPSRASGSGSSILVSPRQKGNPVLACIKSIPWEYSDIPADYALGATTCALFLSLKYHRLHPEYIYTRIRLLQQRFLLRILLVLVDIPNHEDSLRELSKTSLVNNVTVILCWSAAEAGRYLELYKSYEHASAAGIKGQQATGYAERLVEFVTVPRVVNKADAVALVGTFGSLRGAVNADGDTLGTVGGWGERKVKAWRRAVEAPFRGRKREGGKGVLRGAVSIGGVPSGGGAGRGTQGVRGARGGGARKTSGGAVRRVGKSLEVVGEVRFGSDEDEDEDEDEEGEEAMRVVEGGEWGQQGVSQAAASSNSAPAPAPAPAAKRKEPELSEGIAAALAKLRNNG